MTGTDDLRSRLGALANTDAEFIDGARVVSKGGIPTPLQAILTEINDTVLTRDLKFQFGESGSIVLVVSGRRLLGVRSIDGLAMPVVAKQLAEQQISGHDDPKLRALVGVLLPLDMLTETVTTTSTHVEWTGPETGTGVGCERFADKLSIAFPIKPMTRMSHFKSRLGTQPLASVQRMVSGEEVTEGEESDLDWLFAHAGSFLAQARPVDDSRKMAFLGQSGDDGKSIFGAFDGNESIIWVESRADMGGLCTLWHQIYAS